ncbi:MAG: FAD-dependent oxidoreductase [Proteobacteria bacterium]|nr:FAD-dependent oxidoreductase [Pseudomonadota bacterium]NIS70292.1 FAD-dependent oxidoreductase [Pseudomonadota bacterium]
MANQGVLKRGPLSPPSNPGSSNQEEGVSKHRVIIVGAGPAGIFAALKLKGAGLRHILIIEQGEDIERRRRDTGRDILCGWGGAGAFSDGKLTLSPEIGGFLEDFISRDELKNLLIEADGLYLHYGAPKKTFGSPSEKTETLTYLARQAGMEFIPTEIRHVGTENWAKILKKMREDLGKEVTVRTKTRVEHLWVNKGAVRGVELEDGQKLAADCVIVSPGRFGADWVKREMERLGLSSSPNPVDIGVRIESPAVILKDLTDTAYESKLIYYSKTFDDRVRTFCMNPYGEVVIEESNGIVTVNGHSYANRKTENTNFAILVSSNFTEPFDDPINYGGVIARLANLLGRGVIIQRLGDLMEGRRSTPERITRCITRPTLSSATPGDLSFVLPYRYLKDIMEMLEAMDKIAPGIFSHHTLLYGVEVKFYSNRISLSPTLESQVKNLFFIGDGAGITRGLLQASASGILAAREILKRV